MSWCYIVGMVCECEYRERWWSCAGCFFFQAEDGIRDLVRSRGLGDVYKRQVIVVVKIAVNADGKGGPFGGR